MSKTVLSMTIKLPPHNENLLDETLLRGSDEKYFWPWLRKHHPEKTDTGSFAGEEGAVNLTARYRNVRKRKKAVRA